MAKAKRGHKAGKEASFEQSFEQRMEDFGEEIGNIGERFGCEAEKQGKRFERKARSTFGVFGPLISSIFGVVVLTIGLWLLGFVALASGMNVLHGIRSFFLANLGLFFILFLAFNYAEYFSKIWPRAYRPFSPLVTAAGIVVAVWVIASVVLMPSFPAGPLPMQWMASYAMGKIFWVFAFVAMVGYLIMILAGKDKGTRREEVFMAKTKSKSHSVQGKRLYRSGKDKVLGGVCGGLGEYLDVDPVVIRLIWAFGTLITWGTGILLYIIAWIVIPRNPKHKW